MRKFIPIIFALLISAFVQHTAELSVQKGIISVLLTILAIFFGFYITSFAVFSTSKYLSTLHNIQDKHDNRISLLDRLLEQFKFSTRFLLFSIIYLVLLYVFIENHKVGLVFYFVYFLWGVLFLNIFYIFRSISVFIKITRQSAKED